MNEGAHFDIKLQFVFNNLCRLVTSDTFMFDMVMLTELDVSFFDGSFGVGAVGGGGVGSPLSRPK